MIALKSLRFIGLLAIPARQTLSNSRVAAWPEEKSGPRTRG